MSKGKQLGNTLVERVEYLYLYCRNIIEKYKVDFLLCGYNETLNALNEMAPDVQ